MSSGFQIGVDGGGSKTECILLDADGAIVARTLAPGSNPSIVGPEQARLIVTDALCGLVERARQSAADVKITATLLCMAGNRTFWRELAGSLTGFGRVTAVDDSVPVLELATRGEPGLVLHAGTGSFVAARAPDGSLHYAGGLGWRFGDPGSGYEIGRRAVARALLEAQGWAVPTRLGPTVRDHAALPADADATALSRHFYQHADPNRHIAALAPAVLRLASEGDGTAQALVAETVAELAGLATKMAARLFPTVALDALRSGLSGTILTHPFVIATVTPRTPLPLAPVEGAPIDGVRHLLIRRAR